MFTSSCRIALVLITLAAAACTNTVEGQSPPPGRTDSAQTAQGTDPQGSTSQGSSQGSGTSSNTTKSQSPTCPEIDVPACASTDELVTGVDEDGCSYAYCKPNGCPPIDVPQCAPGQGLKYTTDENGCTFATCE